MDKNTNGITDHSTSPSFENGGLANKKQRIIKVIRIYNPSFSESELDSALSKRSNKFFELATNKTPNNYLQIQDAELTQKLYNEITDHQGLFVMENTVKESGGDVLSDVSSMLPTANPMSVITPMSNGGGVDREVRVMQETGGSWIVQIWTNQWDSYSRHRFFQDAYTIKEMIEKRRYSESSIIDKIKEQNKYGLSEKIAPYHFNLERYKNGGEVEFIDYNNHQIMFEPTYKEYFVNDEQFKTLEDAKKYIDKGAKPSKKTINAYRHGAFKNGGDIKNDKMNNDKLTEKDLDDLIRESIRECRSLPHVCEFSQTEAGFDRIFNRVKEHILIRGIDNVDSALALVGQELEQPYAENPNN